MFGIHLQKYSYICCSYDFFISVSIDLWFLFIYWSWINNVNYSNHFIVVQLETLIKVPLIPAILPRICNLF